MAWITKPSATEKIERRGEAYLTDAMRTSITDDFIPRFETTMACILPALHMIQHEYGWIPKQAMEEIARHLEVAPADVFDTATFYEEYWLKPKGKCLISVCRSIACEVCGQQEITDAVREKLGIEVSETTDDGKFTLVELECLGACGGAPAILVGETLHEKVTPEQVVEIIDRVEREIDAGGGH
ncbi:MAG: NADH-quinone oxidoreductase subunit NuoE [Phycisphaeraceae bacterium]|nr:MAG: NADH-quinone oxidoreductase subunit NuoE [Phycisphaeraceae bacterium]